MDSQSQDRDRFSFPPAVLSSTQRTPSFVACVQSPGGQLCAWRQWSSVGRDLPTAYPRNAPFASGYTFEGKPHDYLPDAVGMRSNGTFFIAEAAMENDTWQDRKLGLRLHDAWRVSDGVSSGLARNERSRYEIFLALKNER